jgi:hypothetical protein
LHRIVLWCVKIKFYRLWIVDIKRIVAKYNGYLQYAISRYAKACKFTNIRADIAKLWNYIVDEQTRFLPIQYLTIEEKEIIRDLIKAVCIEFEITEEDVVWHEPSFDKQIKMSFEDNINMLLLYPEIAVYRKTNNIKTYIEDNFTYNYVNTILPEHQAVLEAFNVVITNNPYK